MAVTYTKTIAVTLQSNKEAGEIVINESDFDPALHKRVAPIKASLSVVPTALETVSADDEGEDDASN